MYKLVFQIIIRQWDKSQLSEQHQQSRADLPDRYPISSSAFVLSYGKILLDQHGDDVSGNRVRHQLTGAEFLLIDRFRIDLNAKTVEFKPRLQADEPPILLSKLGDGWIQCQYQWRYRIEEGGFVYWLYENVIVNICFLEEMDASVFMVEPPRQRFENLLSS
ncbi:hypothetical protein [Methylophaga sp.]|uniref:hypothetical protein n=1 Tax=Methylophaga sp. TaxID=2024840 RepID=UPI00271AC22E|nr:hypothetical protein [Methylophaga sp.]MDO8828345.1 hypothetical protein [Methylophaga sp.]